MGTYGVVKKNRNSTRVCKPAEWIVQAACRKYNPELFFSLSKHRIETAKQICAECPVLIECQAWALKSEQDVALAFRHGVIGGMTPEERVASTSIDT